MLYAILYNYTIQYLKCVLSLYSAVSEWMLSIFQVFASVVLQIQLFIVVLGNSLSSPCSYYTTCALKYIYLLIQILYFILSVCLLYWV